MAGNPVLGFLSVQPTSAGPHATVTKMLRLLGIAVLIGAAFSVLNALLIMVMGTAYFDAGVAGAAAASAVVSLVISLAIAAAICFWITYTVTAWNNRDPRGSTHALVLAILATVFGAIGVLGGLTGAALGAAIFGSGATALYMVINGLGLLVSALEAYCGIMILMNRSKATGTGATTPGATGH
ncbi:MAG: hypothetical protein WC876_05110 [Candidatus Thermoplasmatota archaeon]|jgi:hypothetical protein